MELPTNDIFLQITGYQFIKEISHSLRSVDMTGAEGYLRGCKKGGASRRPFYTLFPLMPLSPRPEMRSEAEHRRERSPDLSIRPDYFFMSLYYEATRREAGDSK